MNQTQLLQHFDTLAETPDAVAKLRGLILEIAIQGRLSTRNPKDEPVSELVARIKSKSAADDDARAKKTRDAVDDEPTQDFWYPLPEGWATLPLGTVTNIIRGITFPSSAKSKVREPNTVACLRTANVQAEIEWDDILFIPEEFVNRDDQWLQPDDLIISMANSAALVGKIAQASMIPEKATFGGFLAVIRPIELDPSYLLNYLRAPSMQAAFRATSSQTTNIANISLGGMRPLPVAIPPLAEQRRIVAKVEELLALCDELAARQTAAREQRTRLVRSALDHLTTAKTEPEFRQHAAFVLQHSDLVLDSISQLRQGILALAVQGRLVRRVPKDGSGADVVSKFSLREQPDSDHILDLALPAHWAITAFSNIARIRSGVTKGRNLADRQTKSFPYLRVANVQRGFLELDVMKHIDIPAEELKKFRLEPNDLLITEGGDWDKVGRTAIWHGEIAECIHQNHIFRARLVSEELKPVWFMLYLNSPIGRRYFESASKQTTNLASINATELRGCPVPIPPLAEQQRIVVKVEELMRWCDALEARLTTAQTTAEYLLDATLRQILAA